ncbi:16S rRNA (cytosine(1402)-N(4))-methyltransferase RsmH [Patescibacteria group bacterium]|nr:16S rRNA (cytosine(1402)-N(4))-methyltransferase RsmH [Patescibacteria group bacterium]
MERHTTVLMQESIKGLELKQKAVVIDATAGQGGHTRALAEAVGERGTVLALDADPASITRAREATAGAPAHLIFVNGNFRALKEHAERAGITSADGILFDLGWHAGQLDSGRGLSFKEDAPLLMTLNAAPEAYQLTARDIVRDMKEAELAALFKENGERFPGRIARAIVEARKVHAIETAKQLAEIVWAAVPALARRGRIHPATKVFQALRVAVNDELGALQDGIAAALDLLAPGGRVAIISFHSNEDRIVKHAFKAAALAGRGSIITKSPIVPTRGEARENPRARSAKLRIFQKHA